MEALVNGVLSILENDPTLGIIVLSALGFGGYKWLDKRKPANGGKGLNGDAKQIYEKLERMSTDSAKRGEDSEDRHRVLAERVEVIAGHQTTVFSKMDEFKDKLHGVRTAVAVLAERSKNRRHSDDRD
jgi:flagellar biosynthesis component FlhA